MKQPISVLDKQKLLMRKAQELIKQLDNVTVMFRGAYQEERRRDIANQYNQVMNELKSLIIFQHITGDDLLNLLMTKLS